VVVKRGVRAAGSLQAGAGDNGAVVKASGCFGRAHSDVVGRSGRFRARRPDGRQPWFGGRL